MKLVTRTPPSSDFAAFHFLVSLFCVLCAFALQITAQDFKSVHDGVEYAEVTREIAGQPVKMNLLLLNLTKVRLDVHHAMDAAIGTETTSSIATRHGAVAAINAGFFRLDKSQFTGDSAGVLVIDGKLVSESLNKRIAIGISNDEKQTQVVFGHLTTKTFIGTGTDTVFYVSGINRERKDNELILYKPSFAPTTLTTAGGAEIVLNLYCREGPKDPNLIYVSSEFCDGKVSEIRKNRTATLISQNNYVVSIGKDWPALKTFLGYAKYPRSYPYNLFRIGNEFESDDKTKQKFFKNAEDIVGGVPQLVKDGKIDITWEQEKSSKAFVETRHPRTAVAKLKDGRFLMITVDGRQPGVSVGMSLNELAAYLLEIGAMDAMNLDGGGSTTMFLDGKVVNRPSDKDGERKVSDAILVTLRSNNSSLKKP